MFGLKPDDLRVGDWVEDTDPVDPVDPEMVRITERIGPGRFAAVTADGRCTQAVYGVGELVGHVVRH